MHGSFSQCSVFIYKPKSQTCPDNVPTRRVLSPQKSNHIQKFCWMRSYYAFYLFAVTHYADWMTSITTTFTEAEVKASLIPEVVSLCKLWWLLSLVKSVVPTEERVLTPANNNTGPWLRPSDHGLWLSRTIEAPHWARSPQASQINQ